MRQETIDTLIAHAIATIDDTYEGENEVRCANGLAFMVGDDHIRLTMPILDEPDLELICQPELAYWSCDEWTEDTDLITSIFQYGALSVEEVEVLKSKFQKEISDLCSSFLDKLSRQGSNDEIIRIAQDEFGIAFDDVDLALQSLKESTIDSFTFAFLFYVDNI
jgi:hypothetical protein